MPEIQCAECARVRAVTDEDYSPLQVVTGQPLGWYSGDDGEICGDCMSALMRRGNGGASRERLSAW